MKRSIQFKDDDKNIFNIQVEIVDGKFSMSGDCGSSCGQCLDSINPKNEDQKKLVELWHKWHLNDMNAGTEQQENILISHKANNKIDRLEYEKQLEVLNSYKIDGTPLTVLELNKIENKREEIQYLIKTIKGKITPLKNALPKLKEIINNFNSTWYKVPSCVLELKTTKKRDVKQGHKYYDTMWQTASDMKRIKYKISKLEEEIKNIENGELKETLLLTSLYDIHPETKKPYKYGCGWLTRSLPSNIEEETNAVCDNIEEIEEEEKGSVLVSELENMTEEEIKELEIDVNDFSDEILALAVHLELSINELEEIEEKDNCQYSYGAIYYYVGTHEELEEVARNNLTQDDYLWKSAVEAGHTTDGLEEWAEWVVDMDGLGHTLNGYDGSEWEQEVNGTSYTICRQ